MAISAILSFLNHNSPAIQTIFTAVLVVVTSIYACFTWRMAKIMKTQTVSKIKVSNLILGSPFKEKWFTDRLKEGQKGLLHTPIDFTLLCDVRNENSGNGSIDKPILVLTFGNTGPVYKIPPVTKKYKSHQISSSVSETETIDLGGTIFLAGGNSLKEELRYHLSTYNEDGAPREELLNDLINHLSSVRYHILFRDNLDRTSQVEVTNIKAEQEVSRV